MKKVLVIGSGGREHALVRKLQESTEVFACPGNDGMGLDRTHRIQIDLDAKSFPSIAARAQKEGIDLVVVGPDNPLADGIVDVLEKEGISCFGPSAAAAQIEASKAFAKEVMDQANIPTARYEVFNKLKDARNFIFQADWSGDQGWVVKADGLAFGKGVIVCNTKEEGLSAVGKLFPVSGSLVVEEKLIGEELSWMAFCDGENCALLSPARDYKPLKEGNLGPNTGGMGAFSPVPEVYNDNYYYRVEHEVFRPLLKEMKSRGVPFRGLLYAGLMHDRKSDQIKVLEFNARFGDPETQVLLPRIKGELYSWLEASAKGNLGSLPSQVPNRDEAAVVVVACAQGYPDKPEKGSQIEGELSSSDFIIAGAKKTYNRWEVSGGRVLGSVGIGSTLFEAREKAYRNMKKINFSGMQFRRDICN